MLLLAVLYLLGNVELQSLHSLFHGSQDSQELHSEANELNSCHQSIYHKLSGAGCDHKTHVAEVKKCPLCQLTLQAFHLFVSSSARIFSYEGQDEAGAQDVTLPRFTLARIPARAPPAG